MLKKNTPFLKEFEIIFFQDGITKEDVMALTSEVEISNAVFKNLTQKHNDVVVEDNYHQWSSKTFEPGLS